MPQLEPKAETDAEKAARIARGHANLIPAKKGEVRNPTGKNGTCGPWRRYLDEVDPEEPAYGSRRAVLMARLYEKAKQAKGLLLQFAIEQDQGRAKQAPSKLELADHLRQVSRDQWVALIDAMGDQLKSMPPKEVAEVIATLMQKADCRPERFLVAAGNFMGMAEGEAKGARDDAEGLPQQAGEPSVQGQLRAHVPEEVEAGTSPVTGSGDATEQGPAAPSTRAGLPVVPDGEDGE